MGSHMIEFIPFPDFCGPGNVIWLCRFNVLFLDWTFHTHELGVRSAIGRFDSPAWLKDLSDGADDELQIFLYKYLSGMAEVLEKC